MAARRFVPLLFGLLAFAHPDRAAATTLALRAGWAYGLGLELEYRPQHWGVSVSGGFVPGFGPGGYVGAAWGAQPLAESGPVAEAGLFYGQPSPLRVAPAGVGPYVLGGWTFAPAGPVSVRLCAGGGLPLTAAPSFEFLAKLTLGVTF